MPYRNKAEVSVYPKEETKEEQMAREENYCRRSDVKAVMLIVLVPVILLTLLGIFWGVMSMPLCVTSILSIILVSVGSAISISITREWWD
jgi:hypothetical protein